MLLAVACDAAVLRVDVHDGSGYLPVLDIAPADAETGRGLLLVTSLSAEWGSYRTSAGKAVYFTLELQPGADIKIGQLTDVSHCNFQQHLFCNRRRDR